MKSASVDRYEWDRDVVESVSSPRRSMKEVMPEYIPSPRRTEAKSWRREEESSSEEEVSARTMSGKKVNPAYMPKMTSSKAPVRRSTSPMRETFLNESMPRKSAHSDELRSLREEVRSLREEVRSLREEVRSNVRGLISTKSPRPVSKSVPKEEVKRSLQEEFKQSIPSKSVGSFRSKIVSPKSSSVYNPNSLLM